jgi:beta-glucosidase
MGNCASGCKKCISRRRFFSLAAATTAWVLTEDAHGAVTEVEPSPVAAGDAVKPLPGGITPERFEEARQRATEIVAKLTLPEKISQLGCYAPAIERVGLPIFNYYANEALHGLNGRGPVTCFPLPLALGCTWNRSLVRQVFDVTSDETWAWHKKNGMDLALFSPPTVNMGARDPRWGRVGENYSEDPYLAEQMAISTVSAMQGNDPRFLKTIVCAKHYIANETDSDRHTVSASVDPRSFWEYYARVFETVVKQGGVFTVMSSYNSLNGVPTSCSGFLLTDVLRNLWGFQGYVVSDCDAIEDISKTHKFVPTLEEAAALAVNAGCDINCGTTLQDYLAKAVDQMLISESAIDQAAIRSFTGRVLLGSFDPPDENPYNKIPISCLESDAHRELALEAARQSIVLFRNNGNLLPLDRTKIKKIAVIGPMADVCNLGDYCGTSFNLVSPLRGIREYLGLATPPSYRKSANEYAKYDGPLQLEACKEGGHDLSYNTDGTQGWWLKNWVETPGRVKAWASYSGVQFTGATEFHARVATKSDVATMEVRLDDLNGPVLCQIKIPNTGEFQKWANVSAPISAVTGVHSVYLLFLGEPGPLFGIQYFELTPASPIAPESRGPIEVTYAQGCAVVGNRDAKEFLKATNAAKAADLALVFVGADEQVSVEGLDRQSIDLPGAQNELVSAVYAANPKTVLVISSNSPVAVNWSEQDKLQAIVGGHFLGQEQGRALAEVLFGDYNPGGKLSTTWYGKTEDLPDLHDYKLMNGRTYMYFKGKPLHPFGHGLSYTTFRYDKLQLSAETLQHGETLTASVTVTNTGNRAGDEIVQFYVRVSSEANNMVLPLKQLANFDRVHLKPGETKTVKFDLPHSERSLRFWDEATRTLKPVKGGVDFLVGSSCEDIRLTGTIQMV